MTQISDRLGLDPEMKLGLGLSLLFHVLVFLVPVFLAIVGLIDLFQDEIIAEPLGIEAAIVSDLSAAPKVDKPAKKPDEKPKKKTQKVEPKKETKPVPAQANPKPAAETPEASEQKVVALPDKEKPKEKKPEEKKKEEKKPEEKPKKKEEEKKEKKKKKDTSELDSLLASVLNEKAAEETPEKPKKQAAPEPEETSGPQTELISEVPMTASDEDGIRAQIERNWNLGSAAGAPNIDTILVELRIEVQPNGLVTRVELLNNQADPFFRAMAESAIRAVEMSSPLQLPPGKYWPTIKLRFRPSDIM